MGTRVSDKSTRPEKREGAERRGELLKLAGVAVEDPQFSTEVYFSREALDREVASKRFQLSGIS